MANTGHRCVGAMAGVSTSSVFCLATSRNTIYFDSPSSLTSSAVMTDNGKRNVKSALCEMVLPVISLSVSSTEQDDAANDVSFLSERFVVVIFSLLNT